MVVGLPKSGTTTLHKAMTSAGLNSFHWANKTGVCGQLMYRGLIYKNDPLHYLRKFDEITQADVCLPHQSLNFWPQLDFSMLAKIRILYPDLVLILNKREPEKIYNSMTKWHNMHNRIRISDVPGFPQGFGATRDEFIRWISNCYDAFEYFFSSDQRFVAGYIDDPDFKAEIEEVLGVNFAWWGVAGKSTSADTSYPDSL